MAALQFGFRLPGEEASTANTNNNGKRTRTDGNEGTGVLYTQEGVDVSESLKSITTALCHLDMRTRSLEAATFITMETVPENEFVIEALKGTKEFGEMIAKANREKWTKVQKKGIGGPSLFVGYKWLSLIGAKYQDKITGIAKAQITEIFDQAKDHHFMDKVFSHSQAWITNDKQKAFIRFKFQPWYRECELFMVYVLTGTGQGHQKCRIEGQAAPRGPRIIDLEDTMFPIKGKGKGKEQEHGE
jgi:hypothetical protein